MPDTLTLSGMSPARPPAPLTVPLELVGRSAATLRLQELVRRAAMLDVPVLFAAEPGSDVEGVVRDLHARRAPGALLVGVTCADADGARLERLLFGAPDAASPPDLEAVSADSGLARARGGTLWLQDVTELPAALQGRLARVMRDGEVRVNGAPVATRVRFLASAAPAIDADVHEHRFRADLYRRLAASRIDVPPLRQRSDDLPALAARLLEEHFASKGLPARTFTQAALALLGAVSWPGNLAELRDVVERVARSCAHDPLQIRRRAAGHAARPAPRGVCAVRQPARRPAEVRA